MGFKLFEILITRPEIAFLFGVIILMLLFIVIKIGALEKNCMKVQKRLDDAEKKLEKFEEKVEENEEELDIIDKYLNQKNVDSILDAKQDNPIKTDKILRDSKVSTLLDPRKGEENQ